MARKRKEEQKKELEFEHISASGNALSLERTLEDLLFVNVNYKDIDNLKKLRRINRQKYIDIIKGIKDCLNEAI